MIMRIPSRRCLLICAMLVACLLAMAATAQAADRDIRSYVSGNFLLSLDGAQCGFLKSVDGGAVSADVIQEPSGQKYYVKKHIGQPIYEPFAIQIGFSMTKPVYDWIGQSWTKDVPKSGSVTSLDHSLQAKSQRDFYNALITETTIPACDGSSKEPAYMTVQFAPEYTRDGTAAGEMKGDYGKNEQKVWLPSNFRLEIEGLDCAKVNKIDSFTVKRETINIEIGEGRDYIKEASELVFPNLRITISEASAQSWIDWHKDFVISGNNDDSKEKGGSLTFLSSNRTTELAKITFHNLGIVRVGTEKSEANADQIRRVVAELYCERMEFEYLNKVIDKNQESGSRSASL